MSRTVIDLLNEEFICVILGAFFSIVGQIIFKGLESSAITKMNSRILYYDLLSIEKHLEHLHRRDSSSKGSAPKTVSLTWNPDFRYTPDWQQIISNLTYLSSEQIQLLYGIYDCIYNYDLGYQKDMGLSVNTYKENLWSYIKSNDYKKLQISLRHHVKPTLFERVKSCIHKKL